jgi:hypothetical protein
MGLTEAPQASPPQAVTIGRPLGKSQAGPVRQLDPSGRGWPFGARVRAVPDNCGLATGLPGPESLRVWLGLPPVGATYSLGRLAAVLWHPDQHSHLLGQRRDTLPAGRRAQTRCSIMCDRLCASPGLVAYGRPRLDLQCRSPEKVYIYSVNAAMFSGGTLCGALACG